MSSDFLLISPAAPHRKNADGEYEILVHATVASDIASARYKAQIEPYFLKSLSAETADIYDDREELDTNKLEEYLADIVSSFVLECYDDSETALLTYDKPRVFSGGVSWGDAPTEAWNILAVISDLQVFEEAITDEELEGYKPEHWRKVS